MRRGAGTSTTRASICTLPTSANKTRALAAARSRHGSSPARQRRGRRTDLSRGTGELGLGWASAPATPEETGCSGSLVLGGLQPPGGGSGGLKHPQTPHHLPLGVRQPGSGSRRRRSRVVPPACVCARIPAEFRDVAKGPCSVRAPAGVW